MFNIWGPNVLLERTSFSANPLLGEPPSRALLYWDALLNTHPPPPPPPFRAPFSIRFAGWGRGSDGDLPLRDREDPHGCVTAWNVLWHLALHVQDLSAGRPPGALQGCAPLHCPLHRDCVRWCNAQRLCCGVLRVCAALSHRSAV